jgi:hypothetical protein
MELGWWRGHPKVEDRGKGDSRYDKSQRGPQRVEDRRMGRGQACSRPITCHEVVRLRTTNGVRRWKAGISRSLSGGALDERV